MLQIKYQQINNKINELRKYGLFRNGLPLNAASAALTANLLPIKLLKSFGTFVFPILEFGLHIWSPTRKLANW